MKKIVLFTFLSLSVFSVSQAQISLLPRAGISISNVAFDSNVTGQRSAIGFTGGFGVNFSLSDDDFFSIQPELLYVQKGYDIRTAGLFAIDGTYRLNYLELPVLAKISFGTDQVRFYINAGPSIGYLLGGRVAGQWNIVGFGSNVNEAIRFTANPVIPLVELDANRLDVGANFGAGIGFAVGGNIIFFDGRYNAGLLNYNRREPSMNRTFLITAGVQVPL
jgi:hypothetical protein